MKHLYFIRHGLSEMNVAGVHSGHTDTNLTEIGREQARQAAEEAKKLGLSFDLIVSSPLIRAYDTAKIVAEILEYPIEMIELIHILKERNFGELEGKNIKEYLGIELEAYAADETVLDNVPKAETLQELYNRASALLELLKEKSEETILVASHGAFGRALARVIHGEPYNSARPALDNAKIIKLI